MRGLRQTQVKVLESEAIFFLCKDCRETVRREWSRKRSGRKQRRTTVSDHTPVADEEAAGVEEAAGMEESAGVEEAADVEEAAGVEEAASVEEAAGKEEAALGSQPEGVAPEEVEETASDHTYHRKKQEEVEREAAGDLEEQATASTVPEASETDLESPPVTEFVSFSGYVEEEEDAAETEEKESVEVAVMVKTREAADEKEDEEISEVPAMAEAGTEAGDELAAEATREVLAVEEAREVTATVETIESPAVAEETSVSPAVELRETTTAEVAETNEATEDRQEFTSWMGVGRHTWEKVLNGTRMPRRPGKLQRQLWLFGDSILKGVGKEIHFLTSGYYRIMDRTEGGARITMIRNIVERHLEKLRPNDLVVVEGGGNGLVEVGEQKTVEILKEIVKMVKAKVGENVLVMCVPRRQRKEGTVYDRKRRWMNAECVSKFEEWKCDGLQLCEQMSWNRVWAMDGVHLSNCGKVWAGWNIVEWARYKEEEKREE